MHVIRKQKLGLGDEGSWKDGVRKNRGQRRREINENKYNEMCA